jgi:hypothetical protein
MAAGEGSGRDRSPGTPLHLRRKEEHQAATGPGDGLWRCPAADAGDTGPDRSTTSIPTSGSPGTPLAPVPASPGDGRACMMGVWAQWRYLTLVPKAQSG